MPTQGSAHEIEEERQMRLAMAESLKHFNQIPRSAATAASPMSIDLTENSDGEEVTEDSLWASTFSSAHAQQ